MVRLNYLLDLLLAVVFVIAGSGNPHAAGRYRPVGTSSFRIGGRSSTSYEPGLGTPVAA
jgi:hypothetical protein